MGSKQPLVLLLEACGGVGTAIIENQGAFWPAQGSQFHMVVGAVKSASLCAGSSGVIYAKHIAVLAVPSVRTDIAEQALVRGLCGQGGAPVVPHYHGRAVGVVIPPRHSLNKAPFVTCEKWRWRLLL